MFFISTLEHGLFLIFGFLSIDGAITDRTPIHTAGVGKDH